MKAIDPAKPSVKKDPDFDYNGEWHVRYKGYHFAVYYNRDPLPMWLFSTRFLTNEENMEFGPRKRYGADTILAYNKNEVVAFLMAAVETNDTKILRWAEKK